MPVPTCTGMGRFWKMAEWCRGMLIPCQNLSSRQRRATPLPFAMYLLANVWQRYRCDRVAVLWVQSHSNYAKLFPWVQLWSIRNDARRYPGPYPVICHPPCGPWGCLAWSSKESKEHGIKAMELVHKYGGVVEQPRGSQLFKLHGDGRDVERVNQCDYGHMAQKPTLLYWV